MSNDLQILQAEAAAAYAAMTAARVGAHDSDAGIDGRLRRSLPLCADFGEKPATWKLRFTERLIAAIAVVANRRSTNQNSRRIRHRGERLAKSLRDIHSAIANAEFFCRRPATVGNVVPRQVDDRINTAKSGEIDQPGLRIPRDVCALPTARITAN